MDRINSMRLSCLLLFSTAIFMSVSAYNEENWIPVNESLPVFLWTK